METVWMHFKIAPPSGWLRKNLHQQLKLEKWSHLQILKLAVDGSDSLKYDGGDSKKTWTQNFLFGWKWQLGKPWSIWSL
ncbi:unnamed protein product, partial [Vitis vinifera]|uniref:Uncharacterized protein n=1 Tax=Vitis vinifera TaxID=29760 RepID=D7TG81_VITVI